MKILCRDRPADDCAPVAYAASIRLLAAHGIGHASRPRHPAGPKQIGLFGKKQTFPAGMWAPGVAPQWCFLLWSAKGSDCGA